MTVPSSAEMIERRSIPSTPLQAEWRNFRMLLGRLMDYLLDGFFDLSPGRESRRLFFVSISQAVIFLLYLYFQFSALIQNGFPLQEFFVAILNPSQATTQLTRAQVLLLAIQLLFPVIKGFVLIWLPREIALQLATLYQSDLLELEDLSISRQFILSASLYGSAQELGISEGEVEESSRRSPIYLIGGPGNVRIAMDSAALFELPDGRPHVIGPTGAVQRGTGRRNVSQETVAQLGGFERLRLPVIDLRDQFLGSPGESPESIRSRSRDGIPVEAHDVRFVFSIFRGRQNPSLRTPYPFEPRAVETLIYNLSSRVQEDEARPSVLSTNWKATMQTLIRSELARFMSTRPLNEYLASIGEPEVQQIQNRQHILEENLASVDPEEPARVSLPLTSSPNFTHRATLKSLFDRFTSEFANTAHRRGVELHWVGLGTWRTPSEIIPQHHEEAWRLSRENLQRGSEEALAAVEREAYIEEILRRIQSVPLGTFAEYAKESPRRIKRALIQEYCEQIKEARDLLMKRNERAPLSQQELQTLQTLAETIRKLESNAHFIGGQTGPLPPMP